MHYHVLTLQKSMQQAAGNNNTFTGLFHQRPEIVLQTLLSQYFLKQPAKSHHQATA